MGMKCNVFFLFYLMVSVFIGNTLSAQVFSGGRSQSLSVCQNSAAVPINTLLSADNSSVGVTQNWSVISGPTHGTLVVSYTAITTGTVIIPSGQTYVPSPFYAGPDSFKVQVSDGVSADTTTVYVTVNVLPSVITGGSRTCIGVCIPLANSTPGGVWSSTSAFVTVGSSTGVVCGSAAGGSVITYSLATGCYATKVVTVTATPDFTGAAGICTGATTALVGSFTGGAWVSGSPAIATVGSTSGLVTGISAGTATITYTSSPGCTAVRVIVVSLAPSPIAGINPVCVGLTTLWTNSVTGGSWSSSAPAIATIGSSSGMVTGVSAGTAVISYHTGVGCYISKTTTVVSTPGAITGAANLCMGGSTTLSNTTIGGSWISGNPGVATVGSLSGSVTGIAAGTGVISYSLGGSCVAIRVVTVHPTPSPLSGASDICTGVTAPYTTGVGGGIWTSGSMSIATVGSLSGMVLGVAVGVATITYTTGAGCTATKTLTVHATPSPGVLSGDTVVCVGDSIALTSSVGGGVWTVSNSHAGISIGTVWGVSSGIDTVIYTVATSYCSAAAIHIVLVNPLPNAGVITGADSVCEGATVSLTDAAPGGVWSVTDTLATITSGGVATGVWPGVDTVLYTVTNTCGTAIARHAIRVNRLPIAGVIEGSSDACLGADIILVDTIAGGAWSAVNGAVTVVGGIVTGVSIGVDTIIYTVTNSCGTASATKTVIVNPLPFAGVVTTAGVGAICPGDTVSFTDTVSGGFWSTVTGVAMVSPDGLVTGVVGGVDTVVYSVFNVCGVATASHTVAVNPGPFAGFISGDGAVCAGSAIVLTNSVTGGTWMSSNTVSATVDVTGVVTGIAPGTADIYYVVANGCGTDTARQTIAIEIPVLPILGTSEVCPFELATFIDPTPGGTWSSSNLLVAPVFGGFAIGITPGTTTISYTINNSCGTSVATFDLRVKTAEECNPTAVDNRTLATEGMSIYPNPNFGAFSVKVNAAINEEAQIAITNVAGAIVAKHTFQTNVQYPVTLKVSSGLYFIQVTTSAHTYVDKVVIE